MAHTPGPWTYDRPNDIGAPEIIGAGHEVAQVRYWSGSENVAEVDANARLIAAAPELLEALQALTLSHAQLVNSGDCGNWDVENEAPMQISRAVIAKAAQI